MKDAQGHGSNGRGALGERMNRFVRASNVSAELRDEWMGSGHPKADLAAAHELGQNHPKSSPPVVHRAFGKR